MSSAVAGPITFTDDRFWTGLGIDVTAVAFLAFVVYYRRHRRRDLLMAYVCFNVALFAVVTALTSLPASGNGSAGLALGLGLLGALSIVRLRSDELGFTEVAYFFSSLALAIANGVGLGKPGHCAVISAVVVLTMYVMDHLEPHRKMERMAVQLDEIYGDEASLRAELERRIGTEVVAIWVRQIDYVRETMLLNIEYKPRLAHEHALGENSRRAVSVGQ